MRFNQLNIKESESKGNASDSGQESKDTAELTGPGSTQYIGELGCERGVMTQSFNHDRELSFNEQKNGNLILKELNILMHKCLTDATL